MSKDHSRDVIHFIYCTILATCIWWLYLKKKERLLLPIAMKLYSC